MPNPEWGLLEVCGHQQYMGEVSEESRFGTTMCRVRVPNPDKPDEWKVDLYIGGSAIFRFTPMSEASVRAVLEQRAKREREAEAAWNTRLLKPAEDDDAPSDEPEEC